MDAEPETGGPVGAPRRGHGLLTLGVAAAVILVDQITKAVAVAHLDPARPVDVLGWVVRLRLVRNSGAAFSFATGATWIFTVVAITVSLVILRLLRRLASGLWVAALGLLLGGALGNLVDRLVRPPAVARGHVIDFIEFPHFPVFNVADCCIVTAACAIALLSGLGIGLDGRRVPTEDLGSRAPGTGPIGGTGPAPENGVADV